MFKLLEGQLDRCSLRGCTRHTCLYSTFTVDVNSYANTSASTVASKIQRSIIDKGTTSKQRLLAEKSPQHIKSTLTDNNTNTVFTHRHVHTDCIREIKALEHSAHSSLQLSFQSINVFSFLCDVVKKRYSLCASN